MVELEKQDFKKNKELYNKIEKQLRTKLDFEKFYKKYIIIKNTLYTNIIHFNFTL